MNRLSFAEHPPLPSYLADGKRPQIGIVHLGPGAFFRGHQAFYTHRAMELAGGDWRICAVSLRSPDVAEALMPQDGLYHVAAMEADTELTLIGAIAEVLIAPTQYEQVLARMTAASTHLISMTITEKGYCLAANGTLDTSLAGIVADAAALTQGLEQARCRTAIGLIVQSLWLRHRATVTLPSLLSCDNLTDNGHKLKAALEAFTALVNQADAPAFLVALKRVACPCSMVDSITPATDDALRQLVASQTGLVDAWPIKREAFVQWVIEDCLPAPLPAWAEAGVIFTPDVAAFEKAKLRLLNAPHSTMAYLGCLLGLETVLDAMQQPTVRAIAEQLVNRELLPNIAPIAGLDLAEYSQAIFQRFCNPSVRHLLAQIAWDGSQKLPMRIFPALREQIEAGRPTYWLSLAVAAWLQFVQKRHADGEALVDPLAGELLAIASQCQGDPQDLQRWQQLPLLQSQLPACAWHGELQAAYQCVSQWRAGPAALLTALEHYLTAARRVSKES